MRKLMPSLIALALTLCAAAVLISGRTRRKAAAASAAPAYYAANVAPTAMVGGRLVAMPLRDAVASPVFVSAASRLDEASSQRAASSPSMPRRVRAFRSR